MLNSFPVTFQVWSSKACGCVCKERRYRNCARRQKFVDEETCVCTNVMQGPETNKVSHPKPQQKGNYRELFIRLVIRDINFVPRDKSSDLKIFRYSTDKIKDVVIY